MPILNGLQWVCFGQKSIEKRVKWEHIYILQLCWACCFILFCLVCLFLWSFPLFRMWIAFSLAKYTIPYHWILVYIENNWHAFKSIAQWSAIRIKSGRPTGAFHASQTSKLMGCVIYVVRKTMRDTGQSIDCDIVLMKDDDQSHL